MPASRSCALELLFYIAELITSREYIGQKILLMPEGFRRPRAQKRSIAFGTTLCWLSLYCYVLQEHILTGGILVW